MKNKTARLVGEVDMAGTSVSPELRAAVSPAELVGGLRRKKSSVELVSLTEERR